MIPSKVKDNIITLTNLVTLHLSTYLYIYMSFVQVQVHQSNSPHYSKNSQRTLALLLPFVEHLGFYQAYQFLVRNIFIVENMVSKKSSTLFFEGRDPFDVVEL